MKISLRFPVLDHFLAQEQRNTTGLLASTAGAFGPWADKYHYSCCQRSGGEHEGNAETLLPLRSVAALSSAIPACNGEQSCRPESNVCSWPQVPAEQGSEGRCWGGSCPCQSQRPLHAACCTHSASRRRGDSRQLITYPSTIYLRRSSKLPNDGKMLVIFGHMCFSPKMGQSQMAQQ